MSHNDVFAGSVAGRGASQGENGELFSEELAHLAHVKTVQIATQYAF